jgi:hypothetical protein
MTHTCSVCACVRAGVWAVIEAKSRETEYVAVREQCLRLTDEINAAVVRAQAAFVPGITATPY